MLTAQKPQRNVPESIAEQTKKESEYSTTSFLYNIATRGISAYNATSKDNMLMRDFVNAYQTEYIKEIAKKGDCVIVGRSADYILEDREDCLRCDSEWEKTNAGAKLHP